MTEYPAPVDWIRGKEKVGQGFYKRCVEKMNNNLFVDAAGLILEGGDWGPGSPYGRMYDPKTVQTINGKVIDISTVRPRQGTPEGICMIVETDRETIPVHLGPSWYFEKQDLKVAPKDKVEVSGSKISLDGKPAMIAAEVRKGDEVLTLRDDTGFPLWNVWEHR